MTAVGGSGSPGPGYSALHETVGLWTHPDRVLLRVEGAKAANMLGGLLSADVASMDVGTSLLSFVLNSKGRPLAVPRVLRLDDSIVLDVSGVALQGLLDHLAVYLPPRFATVSRIQGALRRSVIGPRWREAASELGVPLRSAGEVGNAVPGTESAPGCFLIARPREDGAGVDVYDWSGSACGALADVVRDLGGAVATSADYETWRIEHGIPHFGIDVTADNLPQETGLAERAIDFGKGCYTGQEVVARIHYRGHVNRHLRGLRWQGTEPSPILSRGTELFRGGRAMAQVTSSCDSPRFGPIALGYVRREAAPGDRLSTSTDASPDWMVIELPFT